MLKSNNTILFSVVIPTYNHAHFINICLDSILSQTYTNWEIIIVNNFSEDNTIELIDAYKDNRIKIINFRNNGIIAASRNIGIKNAKGDWICFLDSDDWWTPNKLQVCHDRINENVDLIYHDLKIIRNQSAILSRKSLKGQKLSSPVLIDLLVKGNFINNSSVVVRKICLESIDGLNEELQMVACEDYNAWLRISQITDKFLYIPARLGFYRLHELGYSQKDMSVPLRLASAPFINILNENQLRKHESILAYTGGSYEYKKKCFKSACLKFSYGIRYGNTLIKLKSIYMLGRLIFMKFVLIYTSQNKNS